MAKYKPTEFMAEDSVYNKKAADYAVSFIECLNHTKGTWAGKKFELLDWQEQIIRDLFGILKPNGYRQFNTAYIEIPKKNGKSELAAAVALLLTCGDGEERAEVYGCAADRQQAAIVFDVAADMVRMCPALNKRVKILTSQKRIVYIPTNSFYQVLSAEAYSKHGFNIHGVVFDELHTQPNRKLFDVMTKGSGDARMQPLYFLITTAGTDTNSICYEVHQKAKDIIEGRKHDPTFYPVIYTHEAIIPMEIFQAVQKERQRRRELGALANWSINTSCFTSKIKCPICGKNYRRSGKRQRKDPNEVYYIWICRTKSEKGAKFCDAKSIPENKLKAVCAEALGLNEFEETQFSERVRQITVIGDDTLEFSFTDGMVLQKKWKSTAKTDWWTVERRNAWGELHKHKATNPNRRRFYEFTGFIKCGQCGENFRCQGTILKNGTQVRTWHCGRTCGNITVRDEILKDMVCDVLKLDEFSEERMDTELEKITVDGQMITFQFQDGHTESLEYVKPKKKGTKHTEEFKAYMRELMKAKWKERKMHGTKESNNHPSDNKPLHSDTD